MAHVDFAAGTLVRGFEPGYSAFTGFPLVNLAAFDDVGFVSPAVGVDLLDLVRWFWKVQSWTVVFDPAWAAYPVDPLTQIFTSLAADELDLINMLSWQSESQIILSFTPQIVIESGTGAYGLTCGIDDSGAGRLAAIQSGAGDSLVFDDGDDVPITATELSYWPYA